MTTPRIVRVVLRPTAPDSDGAFAAPGRLVLEAPPLEALGVFPVVIGGQLFLEAFGDQSLFAPDDATPQAMRPLRPETPLTAADGWRFVVQELGDGGWEVVAEVAPTPPNRSVAGPRLDCDLLVLPRVVRDAAAEQSALGAGGVAAGLVLRFGTTALAGVLQDRDRPQELVSAWWTGLSEAGRADVIEHLVQLADAVADEAVRLLDDEDRDLPAWDVELLALCGDRDHLASASTLLRRVAPARRPAARIAAADARLRRVLASLVAPLTVDSPLLVHVARERGSWWARPGARDVQ